MRPNGIVTLLTDFGLRDGYVAMMKGVILGIAPHAVLVDITHDVTPQAIGEGAYLLRSGYHYFPPGTIHMVVVDPGVGSERRALAVATPEAYFVGPDNGVLSSVIKDARQKHGADVGVVELTEPRYWLPDISRTFHGRDIFAPVVAHLLQGTPLASLGRPAGPIQEGVSRPPTSVADGSIEGEIVHVDRFGNCITNITRSDLHLRGIGDRLTVLIAGERVPGIYQTYSMGPIGLPMALFGSSGHLEVAVCNGNAAKSLGVMAGDRLRVLPPASDL